MAEHSPSDKAENKAALPDTTMSCTDHNKPIDMHSEKKLITDTYQQHEEDTVIQSSLQPLNKECNLLEEAKGIIIHKQEAISQQVKETKEDDTLNIPYSAKVSYGHIPLVKQQSTVTISLTAPDGSLVHNVPSSLIKCRLTPPDNTPPIQCSVKESSQSGQYDVVFTPLTRGLHQLHITVDDRTIPGNPVSVPVTVPPQMRSTPVKTITGLNQPSGVAVTDGGLVVVSEYTGHCITILDKEGKKMKSLYSSCIDCGVSNKEGVHSFRYPQGLDSTSGRTILVADYGNRRLLEFAMEGGDCLSSIGPLDFHSPLGIAINKTTGQVFVVDNYNHRIQVLNPDLTLSHMFGGSLGRGEGQLALPHDVTIDSQGFVYVTDCHNHRIQKFTAEGQFVCLFGTKGSNPGQLYRPSGITVDDNDLLYINNIQNNYITVYTTNGQYVHSIDNVHQISGYFHGITIDNNGGLLVCCPSENEVRVF